MRNKLKIILAIVFMCCASNLEAWHIEYTNIDGFNSGGLSLTADPDSLYIDGSMNTFGDGGWEIDNYNEDPHTGEVYVDYNDWNYDDSYDEYGEVSFKIVSDYGNTAAVALDVFVSGSASAAGSYFFDGLDYGVDCSGFSAAEVNTDFSSGLAAYAEPYDNDTTEDYLGETISIFANTEYNVTANISLEALIDLLDLPPYTFDSMDDFDDFFNGQDYGIGTTELSGDFDFFMEIDSVEVPLPSTILLLAGGSFLALKRKRS